MNAICHLFLDCLCVLSLPGPLVLISCGVTPWKHLRVLCQTGSHFLLLLKPPRVRHFDVAPLGGCCFIHDPLQSGIQRVVHHVLWVASSCSGCAGSMLASGWIGNRLCGDFIQNLGLGLFSPQESQLPPAWRWLCHDGWMVGWREGCLIRMLSLSSCGWLQQVSGSVSSFFTCLTPHFSLLATKKLWETAFHFHCPADLCYNTTVFICISSTCRALCFCGAS